MSNLPKCPKCSSEYAYEDGPMYVCPECAHEWAKDSVIESTEQKRVVRDAYGNVLQDGDAVTVIKDLKIKGSSSNSGDTILNSIHPSFWVQAFAD